MTIIVMSSEAGSRSADIALGVAERLRLEIADPEVIERRLAKDLDVEPIRVRQLLQRRVSPMKHWKIETRQLSNHLAAQLLELAHRDNVLIQSWWASALLSPVYNVLSVRVRAGSAMTRVKDLARIAMQRLGEGYLPELERFDLVLDTQRMSIARCVQEVADLARSRRFQEDSPSREELADMLQAARARANSVSSGLVVVGGSHFTLFGNPTGEEAIASVERHLRGVDGLDRPVPKGNGHYDVSLSWLL